MRVLVEGRGAGPRRVPEQRCRRPDARSSSRCPSPRSAPSRSRRTCGGCRSSSIARSRSPPASRPTSRRSSRRIDDPLRITYLLASLLDMKRRGQAEAARGEQPHGQARRGGDGALARNRGARAEGADSSRKAEKEMTDAQREYMLRQQLKAIQTELGEGRRRGRGAPQAGGRRARCPSRSTTHRPARSRSPGADDAGVARIPDDPHLSRLGARRSLGQRRPRIASIRSRRAASSTRTTTTSTRSRSGSSNTSRCRSCGSRRGIRAASAAPREFAARFSASSALPASARRRSASRSPAR